MSSFAGANGMIRQNDRTRTCQLRTDDGYLWALKYPPIDSIVPRARHGCPYEKDAHPPIGRVSQIGRVGARPALSVVLFLKYATDLTGQPAQANKTETRKVRGARVCCVFRAFMKLRATSQMRKHGQRNVDLPPRERGSHALPPNG